MRRRARVRWGCVGASVSLCLALACTPFESAPSDEANDSGTSSGNGATQPAATCDDFADALLCDPLDDDVLTRGWLASLSGKSAIRPVAAPDRPSPVLEAYVEDAQGPRSYALLGRDVTGWSTLYARVMVRLDEVPTDDITYPLVLLTQLELDLKEGRLALNQYEGAATPDASVVYKRTSGPVPVAKWFCLEWHVSPNKSTVWMDGNEVIAEDAEFVEPRRFAIGLSSNEPPPAPATIRYDDLLVTRTRVGCPK